VRVCGGGRGCGTPANRVYQVECIAGRTAVAKAGAWWLKVRSHSRRLATRVAPRKGR